jgi:hypothetical protein
MVRRLTPEEISVRDKGRVNIPPVVHEINPDLIPSTETVEAMKVHAAFIAKEMAKGRLVCKG